MRFLYRIFRFPAFLLVCFLALSLLLSAYPSSLWALSYDPYAPIPKEELKDRQDRTERAEFYRPLTEAGALPFGLIKLAVDPLLYNIEDYHVPTKIDWMFDELKEKGIEPILVQGGLGRGLGLNVELVRLLGLHERLPSLEWQNQFKWIPVDKLVQMKSEASLRRVMESPVSLRGGFLYKLQSEEDFWGLGPDSIRARGSTVKIEQVELTSVVDVDLTYSTVLSLESVYQHTNIRNGDDGRMNNIKTGFPTIPGINGDDELNWTLNLENDKRDQPKRPTHGHYEQIAFGYHHGVQGSNARYFKYKAQFSWFWPVLSDRRILAFRFYGEHNSEINGRDVPFFNQAHLGGHLSNPDDGAPLRAYQRNRFIDRSVALFNLEYRYNVWEYRDLKLDTILFWDEGQVFDKFSEWQIKDLRESYGIGFRLFLAEHNIVSLEFAHGDEGTEIYARTGAIF